MVDSNDFGLIKASHAKQAAYGEMAEVQKKMSDLSARISAKTNEIAERQAEYDKELGKNQANWDNYNNAQLDFKAKIADKITSIRECNALEDNFGLMAENDSDPNKAEIYASGANFFARLASEKMLERDQLISEKRAMIRPDSSYVTQLLLALKKLRNERVELLDSYHALKTELSIKRTIFEQAKDKYYAIKNGTEDTTSSSFIPKILDNSENQGLLLDAGIPSEYHETCTMKQRVDGKVDIYYGGNLEMEHGHVIFEDGETIFKREPTPKSIAKT